MSYIGCSQVGVRRRTLLVFHIDNILLFSARFSRQLKKSSSTFQVRNKIVFPRPFVTEFLEFCVERFDIAFWSRNHTEWAEIADQLDPIVTDMTLDNFKFLLSRDPGLNSNHCGIDIDMVLEMLPSYKFEDVVLLGEPASIHWGVPYFAALHPRRFYGDIKDRFLEDTLKTYLQHLLSSSDSAHTFIQSNYPIWSERSLKLSQRVKFRGAYPVPS